MQLPFKGRGRGFSFKKVVSKINEENPLYLTEWAFLAARVVDQEKMSKTLFKALVKHGYVKEAPKDDTVYDWAMTVNTKNIGPEFHNKITCIPPWSQRRLVSMLFFWEEECHRMKALIEEEMHLRTAMEAMDGEDERRDLNLALESVRIQKKLLPSRRPEVQAAYGMVPPASDLPAYA